jgi:GGDEF domain-containing protein
MTDARFYDAASGLLTREAFGFMVDHQLKHAQRSQEFLTLVVFLVERRWREMVGDREWRDYAVAADDWMVKEMARLIRSAVRSTDLLARTADGTVSLLLVGIDTGRARGVIERLDLHLRRYRATPTLQISIGAACCPTDAVGADDLLGAARRLAAAANAIRFQSPDETSAAAPPPNPSPAAALDDPMARRAAYVERRRPVNQRTVGET